MGRRGNYRTNVSRESPRHTDTGHTRTSGLYRETLHVVQQSGEIRHQHTATSAHPSSRSIEHEPQWRKRDRIRNTAHTPWTRPDGPAPNGHTAKSRAH